MSTTKQAHKGYVRELTNSLHACIDTGNEAEAKLVMKLADEYLHEGRITVQDMGDLQDDFDTAFK